MATGLVDVDVEREHEVELAEGLGEAFAIRGRQDGVADRAHEAAHSVLAGARFFHLLGHQTAGQLVIDLRDPALHGLVAAVLEGLPGATGFGSTGGGAGEEHAALGVEASGQHVHHVDQPGREGAVLLGAQADAPVPGALAGAEVPHELARGLWGNAGRDFDTLGRVVGADPFDRIETVGELGEAAGIYEALVEEHLADRKQEIRVGTGLDEDVVTRDFGGLGSPRIDHDDAALAVGAPSDHLLKPLLVIGCGHQAALGDERVAAHADEEVRPLDVGDREHPAVPHHRVERDVLGLLVHRRRRERALGLEAREEGRDVELRADVVPGRVADVVAVGVVAVLLFDRRELRDRELHRLVPLDLRPRAVVVLLDRLVKTLGVFVDLLHRERLRADVSLGARIVAVSLDS